MITPRFSRIRTKELTSFGGSSTPSFTYLFFISVFCRSRSRVKSVEEGPEGGFLRPQLYQPIKTRHIPHFSLLLLHKKNRAAIHFHSTGCKTFLIKSHINFPVHI